MQNPLANFMGVFSLVRDDRGFQVNPLCRHDITRSDRQIGNDCCSSCPGGWSQTILEVKMLNVEVLGWCGYTWSAVVRPVGCTAKFYEKPLETAYGRNIYIQFTAKALMDIPAVSKPIARSLKTCDICGIALCDKTAHFRVAFFVACLRHTCAIIILSKKHTESR